METKRKMLPGVRKTVLTAIMLLVSLSGYTQVRAVNAAHADYLEVFEQLVEQMVDRIEELNEIAVESPQLVDSLRTLMKQVKPDMASQAYELLLNYTSEPWCPEEFCAVMFYLPRESVVKFYGLLPGDAADGEFGRDIKRYLELDPVKTGGDYFDFTAQTPDGDRFRLADLVAQKDVLLILDGHYCMGEEALEFLRDVYEGMDRTKTGFVSVSLSDVREEWLDEVEHFKLPWPFVSDLRGDHSDIVLAYRANETPTCVYIKRGGRVEHFSAGLSRSLQRRLLSLVETE